MKQSRSLSQALPDYIPDAAVKMVADWFDKHPVALRIKKNRLTKLGDFRGSAPGRISYISVNHNLNKYSFLITLLHEMAHAEVHLTSKRRSAPHGTLWKNAYKQITHSYLTPEIFPPQILDVYSQHMINPKASSTTDVALSLVLKQYDNELAQNAEKDLLISMLQPETLFRLPDGRIFKTVQKLRKRYRCYCLSNKRMYLFNPLVTIQKLDE